MNKVWKFNKTGQNAKPFRFFKCAGDPKRRSVTRIAPRDFTHKTVKISRTRRAEQIFTACLKFSVKRGLAREAAVIDQKIERFKSSRDSPVNDRQSEANKTSRKNKTSAGA